MSELAKDIYANLGIRPIINCQGQRTMLGGSRLSDELMEVIDNSNSGWALMREVMEKASSYVAYNMGVEAAYITSGCAAAMTLSAAACISRGDSVKRGLLPDSNGMNNEILLQKKQQYGYERAFTSTGGKLVYVGDENGCTKNQLEMSIGSLTAAIAYLVETPAESSIVSYEETVAIAHGYGIPVIADAAAQIYPVDYFLQVAQTADLVCFGGKFFGAPNATGFVCGKKKMVDLVIEQGFIAFQTQANGERAIGRPMKMDRQSIVAMVSALKTWLTMDHEGRLLKVDSTLSSIQSELNTIPNVKTRIVTNDHYSGSSLLVKMDTVGLGKSPEDVARELDSGEPRIWIVLPRGEFFGAEYLHDNSMESDTFAINAHALDPGEEVVVAERVKQVLSV